MLSKKQFTISLALVTLCFSSSVPFAFAQETANASMREATTQEIRAQIQQPTDGFTIDVANPNTTNPRKFMFEIAPGTSMEDYVLIRNLCDEEKTFSLYGADPTLSAQGTLAYKTKTESTPESEGSWIKFETPKVTLDPEETRMVKFTVTVPKNASYGEHRAGIAMEKSNQDTQNPNITIATRVILHSEIKVTTTPDQIEKKYSEESIAPQEQEQARPWQFWYFLISLTLFIISFSALIVATVWEKKKVHKKKTPHPATHAKSEKTTKPAKKSKPAKKKATKKKTSRK